MRLVDSAKTQAARLYRFMLSPRFAFWLMAAWALLMAVWVVPFTVAGQTEETVGAIALDWLPLQILYWLLAIATVLCTIARVRRDLKRSRARGVPRRAHALASGEELGACTTVVQLASQLDRAGFEVFREDEALWAVRGRYRALWGSIFHLSLLILVASVSMYGATLKTGAMELIEGQPAAEFLMSTTARDDTASFADDLASFKLVSVRPRFFEQYFLFERLDAVAQWRGERRDFSLARPLWLDPTSYVSIQDFNYAPRVVAKAANGAVIDDVVTSLKLFPPGSEDTLDMSPAKVRVSMSIHPDYAVIKGRDASRSYNLSNPRVQVTVTEAVGGVPQQRVLARRLVRLGEAISLPDGNTITIAEIRNVGTFKLVSAPWALAVAVSALLVFFSVAGRLLRPRVEVIAREVGSVVLVDARVDSFGRAAGLERLDEILARAETGAR